MAIKLQYPLSKIYVTQKFALNPQIYKQFGLKGHNGIDFRTKFPDTPKGRRYVYASKVGKVYEVVNQGKSGYGLFVRLMHEGNEQTIYAHLYKSYVKSGQVVEEGQKIALSDNTGFSTAAHLHFGYRPKNFKYNNGYKGYIDPLRLFYKPIATPAPKPAPVKLSVPVKNLQKIYDVCHPKLIECNKRYSNLKISHLELQKSREKLMKKYNILAEDYGKLKEVETKLTICKTAEKEFTEDIKKFKGRINGLELKAKSMSEIVKKPWASKTIWGAFLIAIGQGLRVTQLPDELASVVQLIGFIFIIVGRWVADKPLGFE